MAHPKVLTPSQTLPHLHFLVTLALIAVSRLSHLRR